MGFTIKFQTNYGHYDIIIEKELENLQKLVINIEERIFSTRYSDNDKVNDLQNHFRLIQEEFDVFKNQINYISNTVESIDRILIKETSKRDGSI